MNNNNISLQFNVDEDIAIARYSGANTLEGFLTLNQEILSNLHRFNSNRLLLFRNDTKISEADALKRKFKWNIDGLPENFKAAWVEPDPTKAKAFQVAISCLRKDKPLGARIFETEELARDWLSS